MCAHAHACLCMSIWSFTGLEEAGSGRSHADRGGEASLLPVSLCPAEPCRPARRGWEQEDSGLSQALRPPGAGSQRAANPGERREGCAQRGPGPVGERVEDQTTILPPCPPQLRLLGAGGAPAAPGLWLLKGLGVGADVAATSTLTRGQPSADRVKGRPEGAKQWWQQGRGRDHMGLLPAPSCPLHEDEWLCLLRRPTLRKCSHLLRSCQTSRR